ncbi:uncharacterized protein LOC133378172 [Rhineura floridana]|uniref:uncharacterized protein LOC133378172 n=1 Tax=Rhineura floridana TaxID=261503 RepID=UPI002AC8709A|nr:uncharacterized protein LOC133378172 [Rhineura floridana]
MGNALADITAKKAARLPLSFPTLALITDDFQPTTLTSVPPKETRAWEALGASYRNDLWVMPDGRACLPRSMYFAAVTWHHNKGGHYGTHALVDTISRFWYAPGIQSVCAATVKACSLCQANGPALPNRAPRGGRPAAAAPFQHLQMDFVDLPPAMDCEPCGTRPGMRKRFHSKSKCTLSSQVISCGRKRLSVAVRSCQDSAVLTRFY